MGWHTNRKIIVFESDDWGSIRMPSKSVYENALSMGYRVDLNVYEKYDSLLSEDDLKSLFEVLNEFNDQNEKKPIVTANCVVANPNFEKIKESNFTQYHFESILETFKKYPNHNNSFNLWKEGIEKGFLQFQYHAREHLNVSLFMDSLHSKDTDVLWGFENGMPGMIKKSKNKKMPNPYVEATRFKNLSDMQSKMDIYFEGLNLFENLFGFKSKTIIPTNFLWNYDYDIELIKNGVIGLQGSKKLINPLNTKLLKNRIIAKRNKLQFVDLVRNVDFELSQSINKKETFSNCLKQINSAFMMRKPAIISIHRINFSGGIFIENRTENLNILYDLIKIITRKWPDVEFLSSDQLTEVIIKK